jgi:hypothetical protein
LGESSLARPAPELDFVAQRTKPASGVWSRTSETGLRHSASRTMRSVRSGSGGLGAHSGCPGAGIHRLPDAQIEIQLKARCRIVNRNRFAKASLERPLAGGRDLKTEATEELGKVLAHRRVAELNFDAARTTPRLLQADHPRIEMWSASEGRQGRSLPILLGSGPVLRGVQWVALALLSESGPKPA